MREKVLGLIPARGGSKRLKGKHLLTVAGVPLLQRAVDQASQARLLDKLVLSTDDIELAEMGRKWGAEVPFIRPKSLAADDSKVTDVILHACDRYPEYDIVCLLQPTSPFRRSFHIDAALKLFLDSTDALSLMSVNQANLELSWLKTVDSAGLLVDINRFDRKQVYRGQGPVLYQLNGAIYIMRVADLRRLGTFHTERTIAFEMSRPDSIDIDEQLDLDLAEAVASRGQG